MKSQTRPSGRIVTYACLAVGGISLAAVLWRML